jgi:hypothetical protein
MKYLRIIFIVFVCMGLFVQCAKDGGTATINSSDDTPGISGMLFGKDGLASKNIPVTIRHKSYLADTFGLKLSKITMDALSVTTDGAGKFSFDSILEPDVYLIDAKSGNNAVLIDSVRILQNAERITLAADTLRSMGAIKGMVRLSQRGAPEHAFVLAFGIDHFTNVNTDGSFLFSNLAEGTYSLRIVSCGGDYGSLDTGAIAVVSAETTDVKTLTLPYRGIPVPQNLTTTYDTLRQMVTLRWNRLDTAITPEYNVYRRNIDSNIAFITPLNNFQLQDTVFIDSTAEQDLTYEYRVSAINKNGTEGVKSSAVKVVIASYFIADTVYRIPDGTMEGQVTEIHDMAINDSNDIFISSGDYHDNRIVVFDSAMHYKRQFGMVNYYYPTLMSIDKDQVFVFNLNKADPLLVFSQSGALIDSLKIQQNPNDIDVKHGLIALAGNCRVSLYSLDGILKNTLDFDCGYSQQVEKVKIIDSNNIFIAFESLPPTIAVYDISGVKKSEYALSHFGNISAMAYDATSKMLYVAMTNLDGESLRERKINQVVVVYDKNGFEVANYWLWNTDGSTLLLGMEKNGELLIVKGVEIIKMRFLLRNDVPLNCAN